MSHDIPGVSSVSSELVSIPGGQEVLKIENIGDEDELKINVGREVCSIVEACWVVFVLDDQLEE